MPLVAAQCTNCGAALQVDNTKDAAVCQYCGSAFIVEKAIHNYEINNSYQIENANIVINDDKSFAKRLAAADEYLYQLHEYDAAYNIYAEIESIAPGNHKVWYGKICSKTRNFNADITAEMIINNSAVYIDMERDITNAYRTVHAGEQDAFHNQMTSFLTDCKKSFLRLIDEMEDKKKDAGAQGDTYKDNIRDIEKTNQSIDRQINKMNRKLDFLYYLDKVVTVLMKIAMVLGAFVLLFSFIGFALSFGGSPEYFGFSFLFLAIAVGPALTLFIIHKILDRMWYSKESEAKKEKDKMDKNNQLIGGNKKDIKGAAQLIKYYDETAEKYREYIKNIDATIEKHKI